MESTPSRQPSRTDYSQLSNGRPYNPNLTGGYNPVSSYNEMNYDCSPIRTKEKKNLSWLLYLSPVIIAIIYVIMYWVVLPRYVFNSSIGLIKWLFANPDKIIPSLKDPSTYLNPIYLVVGIKIMGWLLFGGFITSLFMIGHRLQNQKAPISNNALLVGSEAYVTAIDLYEQMKTVSDKNVLSAQKSLYRVCERLKNESDFGSGSTAVINCENDIASCLNSISENIPGLNDEKNVLQAAKNIEMLSQRILSKLKVRIELKKR